MKKTNRTDTRDWSIYKITSPSKAIYVGKSCDIRARISCYSNYHCKTQPLLYRSLKKYGFENHMFEIIETFTSGDSYATEREMFWIETNKSNCKRYINKEFRGLNLTDGGDGMLGHKFSDETKLKMSLIAKGRPSKLIGYKHTDEMKRKLSLALKGRHPNKYKGDTNRLSDDVKKKIGLSKLGNTYNRGRVYTQELKDKMANDRESNLDKYPNHRIIEYKGERNTLTGWARKFGMSHEALGRRLKCGWTIERSFETPLETKFHVKRKVNPIV